MKRVFLMALIAAAVVYAAPVLAQGTIYGTPVEMTLPTTDTEYYYFNDWSDDGKWYVTTLENERFSIWLIPADGGDAFPLIEGDQHNSYVADHFLSNNEELVYRHWYVDDDDGYYYMTLEKININTGDIKRFNLSSGDTYLDTFDTISGQSARGNVSDDGKFLVYYDYGNFSGTRETPYGYEVTYACSWPVAKNLETGEETPIKSFIEQSSHFFDVVRFSPDNSKLMVILPGGGYSTYLIDIPTATWEELPLNLQNHYCSYFSHDGDWILYTQLDWTPEHPWSGTRQYLYHLPSGEHYEMLPESEQQYGYGVWGPDDSEIAYTVYDAKQGERRTHDYSSYRITFAPQKYLNPTAVDDDFPEALATVANYPNPFNPTTTIEYTIPESGLVELVIYNIMGQEIRSLVSGQHQKGTHTVVWDGLNDRGDHVSSGVYITRLKVGETVAAKRMMLSR